MTKRILILTVVLAFGSQSLTYGSFLNGAADKRKTFVAGETIPPMDDRQPELVPGPIPARVRYMFAPNPTVNSSAAKLRACLEQGSRDLFNGSIMVQPGAFKVFKDRCKLSGGPKMSVVDPSNLKKGDVGGGLSMMFVKKDDQLVSISKEISRLLKEDGGFDIRSLKTEEMTKWWVYIMFDIEEPVFVVASKKGHFRFVVELNAKEQIAILDELNGLPK